LPPLTTGRHGGLYRTTRRIAASDYRTTRRFVPDDTAEKLEKPRVSGKFLPDPVVDFQSFELL
jgi:hypothetical protein